AELMEVGCRRLLRHEWRRRARDGERGAANAFDRHWGTPASAATSSAAHCGPRYALAPSSYHSPSECAPCASPPPPMRIAGIPSEIGMFASVLDAVVDDVKPSALPAASAVCTIGAESDWPPVGRMPIVSMTSDSDVECRLRVDGT